jgi:hypothetical protein
MAIRNEKVKWILANHKPEPLAPKAKIKIQGILHRAVASMG